MGEPNPSARRVKHFEELPPGRPTVSCLLLSLFDVIMLVTESKGEDSTGCVLNASAWGDLFSIAPTTGVKFSCCRQY